MVSKIFFSTVNNIKVTYLDDYDRKKYGIFDALQPYKIIKNSDVNFICLRFFLT